MDYEKAYKKALERAKKNWELSNCPSRAMLEEVFPELRESEDERIRKQLLDFLEHLQSQGKSMDFDVWSKADCANWILWLEKQKDFNGLANWNEFKDKPVEVWNAYTKGVVIGLERGRQAVKDHPEDYGLEKQKEQPTNAKLERVIRASRRVLNNWLDGGDNPDVSGDFTELEYAIREYDGEKKQKESNKDKLRKISTPADENWIEIQKQWEKEDEDERIRKGIRCYVEDMPDTYGFAHGIGKADMLAWLEKQKEPCCTDEVKKWKKELDSLCKEHYGQKPSAWESPIMTHEMIMEKQKEQKELPLMDGNADLYFDEWNQQNQNPTKRQCFEEGMRYAERLQKEQNEDVPLQPIIYTEQGEVLAEQKPADEQFPPLEGLDAIKAEYYDKGFKNGFDEGVASVKPAEWSEEDEKNLGKLHRLLIICQGEKKFIPSDEYNKLDKWLKSLKNRGNYSKSNTNSPSWKPSEEQMKALQNAVALTACDKELVRLYDQLKKL